MTDAARGHTTNSYQLTTNSSALSCWRESWITAVVDQSDLDGDGDTAETLCTSSASSFVASIVALESAEYVIGQLDSDYSRYPDTATTVPGGIANYRLEIDNVGNTPIDNIVLYNILPYVGDTGVLVVDELRGSEWRPNLVGTVNVPTGVTVYYSQSRNPCRSELFPNGGEIPSCEDDWSIIPPADLSTVQALKFVFNQLILDPQDGITLEWPMRTPLDAPTNGEIAWDSFALVGKNGVTGEPLLPTEPNKVGIVVTPIQPAAYGDFVWNDLNANGVQDAGEVGLNGVRVELYQDNGDGIANPATDALVNFTLTSNDQNGEPGAYLFPNLEAGAYYSVFYPQPSWIVSPVGSGTNDQLDSDGLESTLNGIIDVAITPIISLSVGAIDLSWDLGLYQVAQQSAVIGNYVWYDENRNGIQDEPAANGLNGVTVQLYSGTTLITETVTADDTNGNPGYYQFDQLPAGSYHLVFVLPDGATGFTSADQGGNDDLDSDANSTGQTPTFVLTGDEVLNHWDAGIILPTGNLTLGDRIWIETDNDGIYEWRK